MFSQLIATIARQFEAPTFDRHRDFAGALIFTCHQTGERYSIIPAGPCGFWVAGSGGRFLDTVDSYTDAAELITRDARDAMRAFRIAA